MVLLCERCKKEVHILEHCNYCNRMICNSCMKSSSRYKKTTRLVICKDCWGSMKRRDAFKSNKTEVSEARSEA
jgi:hypothetical protein